MASKRTQALLFSLVGLALCAPAEAGESSYQIKRARYGHASKKKKSERSWQRDGWELVAVQQTKKGMIARFLAPPHVAGDLPPIGGSLVVDVHLLNPGRSAKVVWRGFSRPNGRGAQAFDTWEPFPRELEKKAPAQKDARLEFIYREVVKASRPPRVRASL